MTNNAWNSNVPVEISKGGTNASTMSTSNGIVKFDGTRLVTSTTDVIDSSNRQTNTSQPCFLAYLNTTTAGVTGDSTYATVPYDSTNFDQGNNFTTGASAHFTAPVTGKYSFTASVFFSNTTGGALPNIFGIQFVTTGRTYSTFNQNPSGETFNNHINCAIIADMTAGDTCYVQGVTGVSPGLPLTPGLANTTAFTGSGSATNMNNWFSGYLLC